MQQTFEIKGIVFGEGRPVICVPVVEKDPDGVIEKIRELTRKKVQMIEWRADCFSRVREPEAVVSVLEAVRPLLSETVFLFTFRTKRQGGQLQPEEQYIRRLNELAAHSGCVDLIDLEFFEATRPEKDIRRFQRMGVGVIASHHDFGCTPDSRIMRMLLEQMQQGGADVAKLAVMPQSTDDVVRLLQVTAEVRGKYPTLPLITMSMGGLGVVSRISGETFGSCVTFGADGEVSAPGQLQLEQLSEILNTLHESAVIR